jgi:subtilisin family serine protease
MDEITIKFGNQSMTLKKSEKLLAVKPRPGLSSKALLELTPELRSLDAATPSLAGFQLLNIEDGEAKMEASLDALRANPAVLSGSHVYQTSSDDVPFVPTGELYVECDPGAALEDCQKLLEEHHLAVVEARGERSLIVHITPESPNPIKVAHALQASPLIAVAEPDLATPGKIAAFVLPGDTHLADQWHLRNTGFHRGTSLGFQIGADARVIEAWTLARHLGSPSVIVAVIDDGFDLDHPDLAGDWKLVAPRDFLRNSASPVPDMLQEDWHGTACAGVAIGNANGTGIVGAAPQARFMPVRWGGSLSDRELENWFGHVQGQGAWVVSCSWSAAAHYFPLSTRAHRAIERCAREGRNGLGTVICFAAGNENRDINAPRSDSVNGFAIHPEVIAVAASNSRDQKSNYSNFGAEISVCAPSSGVGGWGITTADVMGQYTHGGRVYEAGYAPGAFIHDFGGTSSACPLVAGICALLLSLEPGLTAREVKALLERTARRIGGAQAYDAKGHSPYFGHGCVDAAAAVRVLKKARRRKKPETAN